MPELGKRLAELEKMQRGAPPEAPVSWRELFQDGEGDDTPEGLAFTVVKAIFRQALSELGEEKAEEVTWSAFVELDYFLTHGEWPPEFADDPGDLAALQRRYAQRARALWEAGGG